MLTVLRAIALHDYSLPRALLVGSVPGHQDAKHTGEQGGGGPVAR